MKNSEFDDNLFDFEKQNLRKLILQSARKEKFKKRSKQFLMIAASVVLLIGTALYIRIETKPAVNSLVESSAEHAIDGVEGVTLILGSGDNLNLEGENTKIHYSNNGEEVNLGPGKTVNQTSIENNKALYNTLLVPFGKRTDLRLSDGTMVWLNSGSKLVYPAVFNGDTREVYLEGEAIFDVTHNPNMPFKVQSTNQEIEVLGTVFNVSSYKDDDQNYTVLKSGSVKINYSDTNVKGIKITPGTLASYNAVARKTTTKAVDVNDYFSWRDGFLNFDKDTLRIIMTKLSRYYNVQIIIENEDLASQTFSGHLDLKDNVEKIIALIGETSHFETTSKDGIIKIIKLN